MQPDLNDLHYFVQVVDHGGFAAAGRALGLPKSRLSRRIGGLEERLGTRLLQRSTRRFSVTAVGQAYYGHCKEMLAHAEAAEALIETHHAEPCGVVRVSCPVALLDARVAAMLAGFMAKHPRVAIELDATNRRVDLIEERIDLAIRVRPPPLEDSELALRVLARREQWLVGSPLLLERHARPSHPGDLAGLPSLALGLPQYRHRWQLVGPDGSELAVAHRPRLVTRSMNTLRIAAVRGIGIAQLPVMMMREELDRGELVRVLPDWAPPAEIVHVVLPSRRGLAPAVRRLVDYLADEFAALDEA